MEIKNQLPTIFKISSTKYYILLAGLVLLAVYPLITNADPEYAYIDDDNANDDDIILFAIPFTELEIKDFTIHRDVVLRNFKNFMAYYSKPEILNVLMSSVNQSFTEIYKMVIENREKYDELNEDEYINGFLDSWIVYRFIKLNEYFQDNLDTFTEIITSYMEKYKIEELFCTFNPSYQKCDCN